jgi:adenosylcobinamide amidohydrolase
VPATYDRVDPAEHLAELAGALGLVGPGVGMLTAVDLGRVHSEEDGGAWADVSVGTTHPTWAADVEHAVSRSGPVEAVDQVEAVKPPGTINIVAFVPERLSPAALVNAVATATEAKTQALREWGVLATGTASDAMCIACAADGAEDAFGGPRSRWGARLARAVHRAVLAGLAAEAAR